MLVKVKTIYRLTLPFSKICNFYLFFINVILKKLFLVKKFLTLFDWAKCNVYDLKNVFFNEGVFLVAKNLFLFFTHIFSCKQTLQCFILHKITHN